MVRKIVGLIPFVIGAVALVYGQMMLAQEKLTLGLFWSVAGVVLGFVRYLGGAIDWRGWLNRFAEAKAANAAAVIAHHLADSRLEVGPAPAGQDPPDAAPVDTEAASDLCDRHIPPRDKRYEQFVIVALSHDRAAVGV